MKSLNFVVFAILASLLGLVQSVVLPISKSTNSHTSKATSLVHPGHIRTRTGIRTPGDPWQPSETPLHTGSKSHGVPWQLQHTSVSRSENTLAGHPRGEDQSASTPYVEAFTHIRTGSHSRMATGIRHSRFIITDKNTTTVNTRAEVTGVSGPVHCTPDTIFLEPFGNHNINFTYLGCPGPLKPHHYTDGTCLCENPSNPYGVSPDMTEAPLQQVPHETLTLLPHQTPSSPLGPYQPFHLKITGPCRFEHEIDSPDSWNGENKIQNYTRYICMTGSVPLLFNNGTCDCISRRTTHTTGHDGTGKVTKTFDTAFSTVHTNGRAPLEVITMMTTYETEHSGLPSASTIADTAADSTVTPHSLAKPGTLFNRTLTVSSTSAKVGGFPFNPNATGMPTTTDITRSSLALEPALFPTNIDTRVTFISEIGKRKTPTPASLSCPEDFQIVNAQHPHPSRKDCPVIVQIPTHQRWGNMSIAYSSLGEFCHLLHTPSRAYLPYGMDLQPIINQFCHGNGIDKRDLVPIPITTSNAFPTLNSAHPRPLVSDAQPINIELYVGDDIDSGVDTDPRYVTRFYPKGLAAFCSFLEDESEEYIKSLLPLGADRKQVIAEYCKGVSKYKREPAPTTTTYTYETIKSASPTPTNDRDPVCLEFLVSDEPAGDGQFQPKHVTECFALGLQDFCYQTSLWHSANPTGSGADWGVPRVDVEQVLKKYCR